MSELEREPSRSGADPAEPPVTHEAPTAEAPAASATPQSAPPNHPEIDDQNITLANLPWELTDPKDDRSLPPWFRRAVVLVLALMVIARVVVWAFGELASFWYTLFLAFFIGLTLEPLVNRMASRGMSRGVATILVMLGLFASAAAFFALFGGLLASQLAQLIQSLPDILDQVLDYVNAKAGTDYAVSDLLDQIGIGYDDIAKSAANVGLGLLNILTTAVGLVFSLFTTALFAFYFAADGPRFRRTVASWLSPGQQRTFLTVWDISTQKAGGYVISRVVLAAFSSIFHGTVFFLLDLPYWLPLALWVGLVSQFIPTIGTYLAGALPIVIALVDGDVVKALIVLAAVLVYQQVENYFVAPRVTQSTLEIHPAVAFGSVLVGGSLFGAMGALLSIPVVATIQALISVYGRRYQLVTDFGTTAGATDRERVEAAIRATSDEVGQAPRPRPPHPPRPRVPHAPRPRPPHAPWTRPHPKDDPAASGGVPPSGAERRPDEPGVGEADGPAR